jgi:hypothetical protein
MPEIYFSSLLLHFKCYIVLKKDCYFKMFWWLALVFRILGVLVLNLRSETILTDSLSGDIIQCATNNMRGFMVSDISKQSVDEAITDRYVSKLVTFPAFMPTAL